MTDWRVREVGNETRSRDLNEWIEDSAEGSATTATTSYVCECSNGDCLARIDLTHTEYEDVRAHPTRFAIALDHESPDLDVVISEYRRFTVIRKIPGLPARLAIASDPRQPGSAPA
jgi:3,4-dihydroxy-2-butanone 4-phosphate synthase